MFNLNKIQRSLLSLAQNIGGYRSHRWHHHRRGAFDVDIVTMVAEQLLMVQIDHFTLYRCNIRYKLHLPASDCPEQEK